MKKRFSIENRIKVVLDLHEKCFMRVHTKFFVKTQDYFLKKTWKYVEDQTLDKVHQCIWQGVGAHFGASPFFREF